MLAIMLSGLFFPMTNTSIDNTESNYYVYVPTGGL